jgi:hypothetical protein
MAKQNDPEPSNSGRQAGGKFASGNKISNGRKAGSRNRASILAQEMIDSDGELVVQKALELAKGGDGAALRLIMERLIPPRKDKIIEFKLPQINNGQDASAAMAQVIEGVSAGELTPREGDSLAKLIESAGRLVEISLLEARVAALEATSK